MADEMQEMQPNLEIEAGSPQGTPPLQVRFFNKPEPIGMVDGYPKHRDVIWCEKSVPGSRLGIHSQPMNDKDKERFPQTWAKFKDITARPREGMPIEEWAQITKSEAMNLRAMNIHTVEALAAVSDGNVGNLGQGGRELVARAKAFIEQAKDNAINAKMAAENQELKDQIAELVHRVNTLQNLIGENQVPAKRGPGRPRKEIAA